MLGRTDNQAAPANPPGQTRDGAATKVKVFLCHAKIDGTEPARRIRDYIYSQTQVAAFYDENDIRFGSAFRRVLERDVQSEDAAALIAVRSARYASRPWCRRELSLFRRSIPETPDPLTASRWRLSRATRAQGAGDAGWFAVASGIIFDRSICFLRFASMATGRHILTVLRVLAPRCAGDLSPRVRRPVHYAPQGR